MELSGTGGSEDRIAALENKLTDMEALVKGLIAELLDLKALAMTMSRQTDERNRQDLKRGPVVQGTTSPDIAGPSSPFIITPSTGSTVIQPRGIHQPDVTVAPAEPEMVRIMQSDGTMKLEPRYGEAKHIDSSGGYGRNRKDTSARSKQTPLIYAADKDKPDRAKV
jgi:hypothetical protein